MAEIRPFRGVRYNRQLVRDLSAVICPPYDIISPQMQDELYRRSEHNFVRVEFNRELPQDNAQDNRYTRSADTIRRWLEQGVLKTDEAPAIYIHDHYLSTQGKQHKRRNVIACVQLEEWDKMVIRPHESVLSKPKSDRLSMLWACQANTSPILAMFEDPGQKVANLLAAQAANQPVISVDNSTGEKHKVWAISDPKVIGEIQEKLSPQPFYIADGHHRYDSALTYRREMVACSASATGEEPYHFVMMSLVDFADPGLMILPPHRLVRGISRATFHELESQLKSFFEIESLPMTKHDVWQRVDSLLTGITPRTKRTRLAVFGLNDENLLVLTPHDFATVSQMMPYFHSELYKKLDVSLVDHIILEKLLGITKDREDAVLAYSYDRVDAVNRVRNQEYQLAFILNPVNPELVKAIADAGDRMPRKSTYFYPKSPAGLVFYRW